MAVGLRVNDPLKTRTEHVLFRVKIVFYYCHISIPPYKNTLDIIITISFIKSIYYFSNLSNIVAIIVL